MMFWLVPTEGRTSNAVSAIAMKERRCTDVTSRRGALERRRVTLVPAAGPHGNDDDDETEHRHAFGDWAPTRAEPEMDRGVPGLGDRRQERTDEGERRAAAPRATIRW